jgi:hypothetical protein
MGSQTPIASKFSIGLLPKLLVSCCLFALVFFLGSTNDGGVLRGEEAAPLGQTPLADFALGLDTLLKDAEASLVKEYGGEAIASLCSTYLAPSEPHEWAASCDANCARAEVTSLGWDFGARSVVDLTGGLGGSFSEAAGETALRLPDLLRGGEAQGSVGVAVLAARALAQLGAGKPALLLLPTSVDATVSGSGGGAGGAQSLSPPSWVREEYPALPAALRLASQRAYHAGLGALAAALSSPAAVLAAVLPSIVPQASRDPRHSTVLLFLPPKGASLSTTAASLHSLQALVCALAPGWSVEVQSGHLRVYGPLRQYTVPPRQMPPSLWSEYTNFGEFPVKHQYYNQAIEPGGQPITVNYDNGTISVLTWKAGRREQEYYGVTDIYLYAVLDRHPELIKGKRVAILGSLVPWYECIALVYGANPIYTVEYGKRTSDDPRFQFITPSSMEAMVAANTWEPFDTALSISSFEHDGLGRYGDPLSPNADLATMDFVRTKVLKPGGHLLFSVPCGVDHVLFNEMRVYGPKRLKRILEPWSVVDSGGMDWETLNNPNHALGFWFQPVFLLSNKK